MVVDYICVNGTQIRVLKKSNEIGFCRLLKSRDCRALESEISLEVLSNLADQALEGEFSNQELRALLVLSDFTRATVPGRNLCGFLTPPVAGADFRAALVASCFRGAFPPVDFRAVCLVRAM
ncbi:hypothetical protein GH714_016244 [Hevea brasiliensis]|uniref:Uncharacterized protein n=1 Tax=Hevea brasiliensis TaxID=3981 RepID=A0A6A6LQE3_HEVBR|nr:hypothetical protein GH714_016244 [Hevea brasiliensis]